VRSTHGVKQEGNVVERKIIFIYFKVHNIHRGNHMNQESHEHISQIYSHIVCMRMTSPRIGPPLVRIGPQMVKRVARNLLLW
jgi:hypothetical protein